MQQVSVQCIKKLTQKSGDKKLFWLHDDGADRIKILKMIVEFVQVLESKGCTAEIIYSDHSTKVSKEELQEAVKEFPTRITAFK